LHFGILVPNFGDCCGSAKTLADLAVVGESAGWDGFFVFDHILYSGGFESPVVDPWVTLAAIAVRTNRIRIGTLSTPIARRRPWKLARETVSLDHLSAGRLILGVALGDPADLEFESFDESIDDRVRAKKLDEGLEILEGLWSGEPFSYNGTYHSVRDVRFLPRCLQSPRIPIWVSGRWPRKAPFRRAARWDGVFPLGLARGSKLSPDEVRDVITFIKKYRSDTSSYDVVATSGADGQASPPELLSAYETVGATWWMDDMRRSCNSHEELMTRIKKGPPITRMT
jgi:alkanesulfonate monooxygenase SsuD/methylene tetrahydromethanopterin reductase-like flavin-dependent oxidoreductase (luciferase family)